MIHGRCINWIHLHLLQGSYNKQWKLAYYGVGKKCKSIMQWFEVKTAICWNLELTKAKRLPPRIIRCLQSFYSETASRYYSILVLKVMGMASLDMPMGL